MSVILLLKIGCEVVLFFCAIGLLLCEKERRRCKRCFAK